MGLLGWTEPAATTGSRYHPEMWWAWTADTGWAEELRVGLVHPYQSLNEALVDAVPGDRILLDAGRYAEDTDLVDVDGLEIVGAGSDPVTGTVFAGGDGPSQWHLDAATNIILRDLAIDGENARRALDIINGSSVDAWNVRLSRGAQATGAGIDVVGSTLSLYGGIVESNVSTGTGGGASGAASVSPPAAAVARSGDGLSLTLCACQAW